MQREVVKSVSQEQARQLLHNKFVVVLGDSIQRSIYKDLVLLLQKDKYLTLQQLKTKGEMTFEQDCLVEGGCLDRLYNGTGYREVRQLQAPHHLIRFYFITRIYSWYMQSVLEDFRKGLKPDIVIVNSCVWDISRYAFKWLEEYKDNLNRFFEELKQILPEETLIIWNMTMPLGERIRGGFLVPEIKEKAAYLREDVIEANFYSGSLADAHGLDVLDLHFQFRLCLHHRTNDGVHWNAIAHRRITFLLLQHIAQAWGVVLPSTLTSIDYNHATNQQPAAMISTKAAERFRADLSSHSHLPTHYYAHRNLCTHSYEYNNLGHEALGYREPPHHHHYHHHQDMRSRRRPRRHYASYAPYAYDRYGNH